MTSHDQQRGARPTEAGRPRQGQNAPRGAPAPKPAPAPFLLPLVPEELELSPFLLALLHSAAFLDVSEEDVVDGPAACAVLDRVGLYLQRVDDDTLEQFADDLERLAEYAENENWSEAAQDFLANFLEACGFVVDEEGEEGEGEDDEEDEGDGDESEGTDERPA
jgi:hypothetical protein